MLNEPHTPLLRYGSAVAIVALALVLTLLLWPMIQPSVFLLFIAAVMVSVWYGGLGPGLLATALTVVVIDYFFLSPLSMRIITLDTFLRLGVFVLVALLISSLTVARKRAEEALRESELKFRSVTQSATDAIIAADGRGHILQDLRSVWLTCHDPWISELRSQVVGEQTVSQFIQCLSQFLSLHF